MSGGKLLGKVRSAFRRDRTDWDLSDAAPFDFSAELEDDEAPKFTQLKVVVSGELSDRPAGAPGSGAAVSTVLVSGEEEDDDSLLDPSAGPPRTNMEPCETCTRRRERMRHRGVMKRLIIAAVLYFLFMTGELTGECLHLLSPDVT